MNKIIQKKYFLTIGLVLLFIKINAQPNNSFRLSNSFTVQYEKMSTKLSLTVFINYTEVYNTFGKNGYYFSGVLEKTYKLSKGTEIDKYPISGFCFSNHIEFGEKSSFDAAKNDYRNDFFKKTYFDGDWNVNKNIYFGSWTLPGKGFAITSKGWLTDFVNILVSLEANDEFKKILDFEIIRLRVLNKNPLTLRIDVVIKNNSVWFLNIDSKNGTSNGGLYIWGMEPKSSQTKNFIINESQNFLVTFYGLEGDTKLKNIANTVWVAATGEPCPDIKGALLELVKMFGDDIAEVIKNNPQKVLTFLVNKGLISPQTNLSQYNFIQQTAGIVSDLLKGVEIITTVIDFPKKLDGILQWRIISKKNTALVKITQ